MYTLFSQPGTFWRGNLHTHSTRSDGTLPPEVVCARYREAGYDFLALTDHFEGGFDWPITDTTPYRTPDFTTILGAELHTMAMEHGNFWHILAVGLPLDFAPTDLHESGPQLAARALAAGAFVAAAHPGWHATTEADVMSLDGIHAIEIYNGSCDDDNDTAECSYMLDLMLARGRRLFACATDDAHFVAGRSDSMRGWVMVKSETLAPDALLAALKRGDYYSSTGVDLYAVQLEGRRLYVRSSPASRIFALGVPSECASEGGTGITEATFNLSTWRSPYVRVVVRDASGRKAWSNPIWF